MRTALFGEDDAAVQQEEMRQILANPAEWGVFVGERPSTGLAGFVEVGIRKYAEGCITTPVAYLEGWYVDADGRQEGLGRQLVIAAETWARENGYSEMASDALIENQISLAAHLSRGFKDVVRQNLFFKKLYGRLLKLVFGL